MIDISITLISLIKSETKFHLFMKNRLIWTQVLGIWFWFVTQSTRHSNQFDQEQIKVTINQDHLQRQSNKKNNKKIINQAN